MSAASERAHTDEAYRNLKALEAIEANPNISQRELARSMGVALGMANACVRTLVRKGLVKIRGESNRSITYHLTKEGSVQKARLAMEWTGNTIDFYVQARSTLSTLLHALAARGVSRVGVYGADEAAELVVMLAPHAGIEVVSVVESSTGRRIADTILGHPVAAVEALSPDPVDAVLVCTKPSGSDLARLRAAYPNAPITSLDGHVVEEINS